MKKLLLAASLVVLGGNAAMACTQAEATAKMQEIYAMPEYTAMLSATDTPEDAQKVVEFNTKVGEAGTLTAQGKFDEACDTYNAAIDMLKGSSEEVQDSEAPTAEDHMEKEAHDGEAH